MQESRFRILKVDLTTGEQDTMSIERDRLRDFLGGASLGASLLYPQLTKDLNPLSPPSPLLFLTGPLTGTKGPAVGRFVICAKSPATQLWAESNVGGHFGPEMRAAGFEGIWITGASPQPVYLWVKDGKAELRPAGHIWGSADTYQTQAQIRDELRDPLVRVAAIGLAGENQIPFALVLCDHGRVAGRTGMGAVMGAKRLKAVAIRGHQEIPLAYPGAFSTLRGMANRALRSDNMTRALRDYGTSSAGDYFDYLGGMPKRYFTSGVFEGSDKVSGPAMAETILTSVSTCHGCVVACGRVVAIDDGENRKGPEYETIAGFGPNLAIDDLAKITLLGELCDRYGMDTISLSNTIGLAILLRQQGLIGDDVAGDDLLEWGNPSAVEQLIHRTARREGFGELLAGGAKALGERFDAGHLAAHVNGLEVAYHDPRGFSGMALVYATSPRGACHNQSDYFLVEIGQSMEEIGVQIFPRQAGAEKAANVARHQDWRTVQNSLVLCLLANVPTHTVLELVNLATGFDYSMQELISVGERGWNMKRLVNYRLGFSRQGERLPDILLQPLPDGGAQGYVPPIEEMLAAYYQARGWDATTGRPTAERLRVLGLAEFINQE